MGWALPKHEWTHPDPESLIARLSLWSAKRTNNRRWMEWGGWTIVSILESGELVTAEAWNRIVRGDDLELPDPT